MFSSHEDQCFSDTICSAFCVEANGFLFVFLRSFWPPTSDLLELGGSERGKVVFIQHGSLLPPWLVDLSRSSSRILKRVWLRPASGVDSVPG